MDDSRVDRDWAGDLGGLEEFSKISFGIFSKVLVSKLTNKYRKNGKNLYFKVPLLLVLLELMDPDFVENPVN